MKLQAWKEPRYWSLLETIFASVSAYRYGGDSARILALDNVGVIPSEATSLDQVGRTFVICLWKHDLTKNQYVYKWKQLHRYTKPDSERSGEGHSGPVLGDSKSSRQFERRMS